MDSFLYLLFVFVFVFLIFFFMDPDYFISGPCIAVHFRANVATRRRAARFGSGWKPAAQPERVDYYTCAKWI